MELRCDNKKHGVFLDDRYLEVKCDSRFCGAVSGTVVLHRFDLHTGEVETSKFQEPPTAKESKHGAGNQRPSLRTA